MRRSTDRIITSHAGSLPRPPELLEQNRAKQRGETVDTARRAQLVREGVRDVVRQQLEVGLDSINDGEFSKTVFLDYTDRMSGFQPAAYNSSPLYRRRNMIEFADFFNELYPGRGGVGMQPTCVGPVSYVGQAAIQADIDNFKAALAGQQYEEAFMPAIAPGTFGRGVNQYYKTEEEFLFAIGDGDARRSTRRSSTPASSSRSTTPACRTPGTRIIPEPTHRGVPQVRPDAHRGAEPRPARPAGGPHPLPHLLGQLARPAHHRHPARGHRRPHAQGQRRRLLARGRQRRVTSTSGTSGRTRSCRTASCSSPASSATPPTSSSTRSSSPTASCATPTSSAARTSSPAPTAAWAAASTPQIAWAKLKALSEGAALATKELW